MAAVRRTERHKLEYWELSPLSFFVFSIFYFVLYYMGVFLLEMPCKLVRWSVSAASLFFAAASSIFLGSFNRLLSSCWSSLLIFIAVRSSFSLGCTFIPYSLQGISFRSVSLMTTDQMHILMLFLSSFLAHDEMLCSGLFSMSICHFCLSFRYMERRRLKA